MSLRSIYIWPPLFYQQYRRWCPSNIVLLLWVLLVSMNRFFCLFQSQSLYQIGLWSESISEIFSCINLNLTNSKITSPVCIPANHAAPLGKTLSMTGSSKFWHKADADHRYWLNIITLVRRSTKDKRDIFYSMRITCARKLLTPARIKTAF